jgi:hypothetical protein
MVSTKFAIRDDDVNFFTDPAEIEEAYGMYWHIVPPTLSIITHVKGNWSYWIKEVYNRGVPIDWIEWEMDSKPHPIHNNSLLINFLSEQYKKGNLDLSLHAIHHRILDPLNHDAIKNNYVKGAEFYTERDLTNEVKWALEYVQKEMSITLKVFTPPQNLMSMMGYHAVVNNRLSIVGSGIPFWKKQATFNGIASMLAVSAFKLTHPGIDYPRILRFKHHKEIIHHYPLHPTTHINDLIESFETIRQFNGVFVLSTHYHEFEAPLTYDPLRRMKDVFVEFMNYVEKCDRVEFTSLTRILS